MIALFLYADDIQFSHFYETDIYLPAALEILWCTKVACWPVNKDIIREF